MLILFFVSVEITHAQLTVSPIPRQGTAKKNLKSARTKSDTPVSLPFWDDFSTTTTTFPDTLWVNSNGVYISDGAGINSLSINVATFNGLNAEGSPYNPTDLTANGFTDTLTSRKIKMSEVPIGERNSVYLSFFYQWQGNGEAPDNNDFIRLEFKNQEGNWVIIQTITGAENSDPTIFSSVLIQITEDQFFHDEFQFRLRSYGRLSGPYDTWLVDYVYLNKGRNADELSFPDRSAASAISKLFDRHYAVPIKHFLASKKIDSVRFDVQNLRGPTFGGASINYRATAKYYNYIGDNPPNTYARTLIKSRGVKGETGAMLPYERVRVRLDTLPDPNNVLEFNPDADEIKIQLKMKVISNDSIDPELPAFLPLDFRVNDTISAWYTLKDYYAYDDGIAEYSAGLTQPGNRLAYQFDILTDTATLYGFEIYFPYLGGTNSETLDLFVYGNDNGLPTLSPIYSALSRTITKNGNNEFLFIQIEPLFIQDSTFYIGYKEPVSSNIKVGLDKSNDTGDKIFVYVGDSWSQNTDVKGSLMIRPIFGKGAGDIITDVPRENETIRLYPNPNRGEFYIEDEIIQLNIIDATGRPVGWQIEEMESGNKISMNSPSSGIYLVRWINKKGFYQKKILITR
ncbi:MAG TPA: T9SS type A sorting domain-containing protein [Cyclobacteriaceae bacterium]|nr:T9SS type A sorting domain-containing protein [Cyclobacteriaceae bacterium]